MVIMQNQGSSSQHLATSRWTTIIDDSFATTPQRSRLAVWRNIVPGSLTILNLVIHFAFNAIAIPMEIVSGPQRLVAIEGAQPTVPREQDVLWELLRFKDPMTSFDDLDQINMPLSYHSHRAIKDFTGGSKFFDPELAQRQHIFDNMIAHQLENQLKKSSLDKNLRARIRGYIQKTARLYIPPHITRLGLRGRLTNYYHLLLYRLTPSSKAIVKNIKSDFQRIELPIALRKELWTLMLYHAFHSSEAEDYLINLYRQDDFRKDLIGYMYELYDFPSKGNGMSWPMHWSVFSEGDWETRSTPPAFREFFLFHKYLLQRNLGELMELLDRDVLVSQLESRGLLPKLKIGLKSLPRDWRYQENLQALELANTAIAEVEELHPQQQFSSPIDGSNLWANQLQGALNVLRHLRAYGHQEINDLIKSQIKLAPTHPPAHQ